MSVRAGRQLREEGLGEWVLGLMIGGQMDEASGRCVENLKRTVGSKFRDSAE